MPLEFHQLDRRWERLRVRHPARGALWARRLLASLAESGQQTPIVVVVAEGQADRYVVLDGYKRIAALEQWGRDTVEAVVWPRSEAEAVLLDRSLRLSEQETALEVGLLAEWEQRFGYGLEEWARRFDRSPSWVSRRLALAEALPEAAQQQVREGKVAAQVAMRFLTPVARQSLEDCQRMAALFAQHHCHTREAGQLYAAWRKASRVVRARILAAPELFLKTQRQPPMAPPAAVEPLERDLEMALAILRRAGRRLPEAITEMNGRQQEHAQRQIESARRELAGMAERVGKEQETKHAEPSTTNRHCGTERAGSGPTRDGARAEGIPPDGAPGSAIELHQRAGDSTGGEIRTLPATDPRSFGCLEGESRASP